MKKHGAVFSVFILGLFMLGITFVPAALGIEPEKDSEDKIVKSEEVALPDGWNYRLECQSGNLKLISKRSTAAQDSPELTSEIQQDFIGQARVVEIRLSAWFGSGLFGVCAVETEAGVYDYFCLTFSGENSDGSLNAKSMRVGKMFRSEVKLRILAMDRASSGDGIRVLCGRMIFVNGEMQIKDALLYAHECPQPPVGGEVFLLDAKRPPDMPALEDRMNGPTYVPHIRRER